MKPFILSKYYTKEELAELVNKEIKMEGIHRSLIYKTKIELNKGVYGVRHPFGALYDATTVKLQVPLKKYIISNIQSYYNQFENIMNNLFNIKN